MSDLITQEQPQAVQEQPQAVTEVREQTAGALVVVGKESKNKKFSLPKVNISKIVSFVRQQGVSIAMNLAILVVVCLLFLYQVNRSKGGNKVVGHIDEEKVIENLTKNLDLDKDTSKTAHKKQTKGNTLVKQEKETPDLKNESRAMKVDNSKYVIEA